MSHDHHDHTHNHGHDHDHSHGPVDWKLHGVKVIPGDQLDTNTAQTPGMNRAAAINLARVGAHLAKQSPDFDARNYGFPRLSDLVEASGIVEVERIGENPKIIMVRLKGGPAPRPVK